MIEMLSLPFAFPFMQKAFLVGIMVAVPTAFLSCYMVLKRWALMGDAISHAVLPGIILAYLVALPLAVGAFAAGLACVLATGFIDERTNLKRDTVMGVVFSGMFGGGLILLAKTDSEVHLSHILYGNLLGLDRGEILSVALITLTVTLSLTLFRRDFLLHAFDAAHARAVGLPTALLHYGMLVMIALIVMATLKAVGLVLAIGLIIMPGAIALLLAKQFSSMLILAIAANCAAMVLGILASFFIDSAPAPTVILVLAVFFVIAFVFATCKKR